MRQPHHEHNLLTCILHFCIGAGVSGLGREVCFKKITMFMSNMRSPKTQYENFKTGSLFEIFPFILASWLAGCLACLLAYAPQVDRQILTSTRETEGFVCQSRRCV